MKKTHLLVAYLAFAMAAFAQDNSAKLPLAREVISAMHVDKMFDGMIAQLKQMAAQTAVVPADATPEQRQKAEKLQADVMELSMNAAKGVVAQMDQVYADVYTEGELRAMKAFFLSPEGQSMIAKQPQAMARVMPMMQKMQQELMPKIQKLVEGSKAEDAKAEAPKAP